ncbi:MAG TPA: BTAD domain-containing putative transcriptional regulator [Iamia sp.]|nr:BTAD domain-containing putative transcriptional regulator [Iamia sp.]
MRARRGDEEVALGGPRQRAVLARLALAEGEAVSRERIIEDVWDGEPPRSATNTLQSYVSNLRRTLGDDTTPVIERTGEGYRLDVEAVTLATVAFETAVRRLGRAGEPAEVRIAVVEAALARWHGPALGELADEPWARGPAVRLEEMRLAALEARFDLHLATGGHAAIVGDLESATTAHPLRERFTAQLVLALHRSGRQAESLRAYERCRAHLADELGLDPSPELVRLAAQVLDHDPALDHDPTAPDPSANSGGSTPPEGHGTPRVRVGSGSTGVAVGVEQLGLPAAVEERRARSPFVGRDAEVAALVDEWEGVASATGAGGSRRLAIVTGEPGTGKTRLAQQVARLAHRGGGHVLWGRCSAEALVPYQAFVEAFRTATDAVGLELSRAIVAERPALGRLLPDVLPDAADEARRADLYGLFEALGDLSTDLTAAHPMLLVLDDLQWADPAALGLLAHLLAFERGGRILVLATVRRPAGRPTEDLDRFLADQRRAGSLAEVALAGIDGPAVEALLQSRGQVVDAATAEGLRARTGGNPLFLEALADSDDTLASTDPRALPASVRDVLDGRISALDAGAAAVLSAAAVIGQRVDLALLGAVADRGAEELLDVVDAAVAGGLLVEDEDLGWVAFPHALVRQAFIARTTRNREAHLHLRVADALEGGATAGRDPGATAEHLLAAGRLAPPDRTARAAVAAGAHAIGLLADDAALTWGRRAEEVLRSSPAPCDPAVAAEAALLVARATRVLDGRSERAEAAVAAAVEAAHAVDDPVPLARAAEQSALLKGGMGFGFGVMDPDLAALLEQALGRLGPEHVAERATLLAWSSIARTGVMDLAGQAEQAAEAVAAAEALPPTSSVRALPALARRLAVLGPSGLEERLVLGPQMRAAVDRVNIEMFGLVLDHVDHLEAGMVAEARADLADLRRLSERHRRSVYDAFLLLFEGGLALLEGDLETTARLADEALAIGTEVGADNVAHAWAAKQSSLARERGELGGAAPLLRVQLDAVPNIPVWRSSLALAQVAAGEPEEARATLAPLVVDGRIAVEDSVVWYVVAAHVAEVGWHVGDPEACAVAARELEPYRDRMLVSGLGASCLGPAARELGLAQAGAGRLDEAVDTLAVAVAVSRTHGFGPSEGRSLDGRAAVLRLRGGPGDAEAAAADQAAADAVADGLGISVRLAPHPGPA